MTETPDDRLALRDLMSELSEEAYCAGWHYDTEYRLWEILIGVCDKWMRLDANDARIAELRRLHGETGGWWRWNPDLDEGRGDNEFLPTPAWEQLYAATAESKDRAISAVIGGQKLRGQDAVDATTALFRLHVRKPIS